MMTFHKYHGAGNDFIMINNLNGQFNIAPQYIRFLCDRHVGIGADGVILVESSDKADCFMNYYNADGTTAEMCGNGVRCTAKFFLEQTSQLKEELSVDTRAGIKKITCHKDETYSVDMSAPVFTHNDFPANPITLENVLFNFVSMGNPHAVGIVSDLNKYNISLIGPKIENDKNFPNKINMELVEKINDDYFKVKIWERGCGATLACGTGACAVYSIIKKNNNIDGEITIEFPGGKLFLSENNKGHVILRGPAEFVFRGEIG
jgi:diaminopimelate epimerase